MPSGSNDAGHTTVRTTVAHADDPFGVLRIALDRTPHGVVVSEVDGTILFANALAARLLAYAPDELVGQPLSQLLPSPASEARDDQWDEFWRNPATDATVSGRSISGVRKGGSPVPLEISLNVLADGGKRYVMASIADATERLESRGPPGGGHQLAPGTAASRRRPRRPDRTPPMPTISMRPSPTACGKSARRCSSIASRCGAGIQATRWRFPRTTGCSRRASCRTRRSRSRRSRLRLRGSRKAALLFRERRTSCPMPRSASCAAGTGSIPERCSRWGRLERRSARACLAP